MTGVLAYDDRVTVSTPATLTSDFLVGFPICDTDDIKVYLGGVETAAFTVSATFTDGVSGDAKVFLDAAVSGIEVKIKGARSPRRDEDFISGSAQLARIFDADMVRRTMEIQELRRDVDDVTVAAGSRLALPAFASIATTTVSDDDDVIVTYGYYLAGDGGGGLYKRAASEPSHALKAQSADGAWWELVPQGGAVNVLQAGAKGDNSTDDSAAFVNCLDFANLNTVGTYYDSTWRVDVPPTDDGYYLGATTLQIKTRVRLTGQGSGLPSGRTTQMRWDANVTGIIVHRYNTLGATTEGAPTTGGDGSVIEGLDLVSDGGTIAGITDDTKGHGIWLRARALLRNVQVDGFPGNGIRILATSGGAAAVEGNANSWRIEGGRIIQCHLSGIYIDGADVNAGVGIGIDCSNNGRWGIWDSSFLGNTWVACHAEANGGSLIGENGAGESSYVSYGGNRYAANAAATEAQLVATTPGTDEAVWIFSAAGGTHPNIPAWVAAQPEGTYFHGGSYRTDDANARNVLTGCYEESGQGMAQLVTPTAVLGGPIDGYKGTAPGFVGGALRGIVTVDNHKLYAPARDLTLTFNAAVDHLMKLLVNGDHASGTNLLAWDETAGHVLIGEHANSGARRPIRLTTDLNTYTLGRAAALAGGEILFTKGIWIGEGTNARYLSGFTAKPTSGTYGRGDKVWNYDPITKGDPAGWRITTAGTIGAGAVIEEYFYVPELPSDHEGYLLRPDDAGANRVEWREAPKAGTDTIADTASTQAVAFATAFASASYSVAISADGDERVWITSKATTGFTLNRAGTSGARAVDWAATPHEDL